MCIRDRLWAGVDAGGDGGHSAEGGAAQQEVGHKAPLRLRLVGQHGPADGVPDGVKGGDGGAELSVYPEEPPLQLRQEVPGKEAAGGGPPPGGHQNGVGLQPVRLPPVGEGDGRAGGDAGDAGSGEHLHPVLPELRGQTLAQLPLQGCLLYTSRCV